MFQWLKRNPNGGHHRRRNVSRKAVGPRRLVPRLDVLENRNRAQHVHGDEPRR